MLIRINNNHDIIQFILVGTVPYGTPNFYQIKKEDVTDEILRHILHYQYIDGQFILKSDAAEKLAQVKSTKLANMRTICNQVIEYGIDVNNEHFSLSPEDQMNLTNLSMMAQGGIEQIPYHADGELCRIFTATEIIEIATLAIRWITFHTTYHNFMKAKINDMTDPTTIAEFQYGDTLGSPYMEHVQEMIGGLDPTPYLIHMFDDPIENYSSILDPVDCTETVDAIDFDAAHFSGGPDEEDPDEGGDEGDEPDSDEDIEPTPDDTDEDQTVSGT